jgi:hypothetical protein
MTILNVRCPRCGARPLQQCRTPWGSVHVGRFHLARTAVATSQPPPKGSPAA